MDIEDMKFGCQISPPDERDYHIAGAIPINTTFPDEYEIPEKLGFVYDQKQTMMCVAHSLCAIKTLQEMRETGRKTLFSRSFIYCNRFGEGFIDDNALEGMFPRVALEHLRKQGVCKAELWDELIDNWMIGYNKLTPQMYEDAKKTVIKSYARVESDYEIMSALMTLGALGASIVITPKFGVWNDVLTADYQKKNSYGNHMITIVGWRKHPTNGKKYWKCLNSYSENWGDKGYFYLEFGYLFNEVWAIIDAVNPAPDKPKYYRVQVGAYSQKMNCQAMQLKLKNVGFATYIVQVNGLYKVQCGCFSVRINAENLSKQLKAKGFDNFITYY
jgi:hypothetical protein